MIRRAVNSAWENLLPVSLSSSIILETPIISALKRLANEQGAYGAGRGAGDARDASRGGCDTPLT